MVVGFAARALDFKVAGADCQQFVTVFATVFHFSVSSYALVIEYRCLARWRP